MSEEIRKPAYGDIVLLKSSPRAYMVLTVSDEGVWCRPFEGTYSHKNIIQTKHSDVIEFLTEEDFLKRKGNR